MTWLIDHALEDTEVSTQLSFKLDGFPADLITVYYDCVEIMENCGTDGITVIFSAIQAVGSDGSSPMGCNSCDLGDFTLLHHVDCPVHIVSDISFITDAYADDSCIY